MSSAPRGRPRGFDADEALERAIVVFWERGYDGASLTDLTEAMGIARKSMYAAFGNKEDLFLRAVARYAEGPGGYLARALEAPDAREVARRFLVGAAHAATRPGHPTGCLGVRSALSVTGAGEAARDTLAQWRSQGQESLERCFREALAAGDLPSDAQPDLITRYLLTVANGMTVQAMSGATREDLVRVADAALRHWPPG
ncbi:TetR/AcrR family transcriptional regulator [Pseudonocardia sp. ICBG1293]|uniref:TetR/AcrR family transcriptional regulator n=1 Tax=Pseudonocardia sp. ICBG1293 TaxID=2844382 RepID=UPI001CCAB4D0|nr:TetR/AcrR family transcriptional regulator [Pseudonocardia sp. ICBG1293]